MAQATGETRREVLPKQNVVPLQEQSSVERYLLHGGVGVEEVGPHPPRVVSQGQVGPRRRPLSKRIDLRGR